MTTLPPEGIPQDVLALAEEAYQQAIHMTTKDEPQNMVRMVAKAILAERERVVAECSAKAKRCGDIYEKVGGQRNLGAASAMRQFAFDLVNPAHPKPSNDDFRSVPVLGDVS